MRKAAAFRDLLESGQRPLLAAGAHDGLGAVLAARSGFDAAWASSFEISASRALPDASLLGMYDMLAAAHIIDRATDIPVIADCDTGFGNAVNVALMAREYEAAGIAAVCIEDKVYPKLNSFVASSQQLLVEVADFQHKLEVAKSAMSAGEMVLIARTEALITGESMAEALARAHAYVEAGADAILIHSKASTPDEVLEFLHRWQRRSPVVVVPTTYYSWSVTEAWQAGASLIIYANQGLRASIRAITDTFDAIKQAGSSASVEDRISSVKDVFAVQSMAEWLDFEDPAGTWGNATTARNRVASR